MIYEREGYEEQTPIDEIWVRDGRGKMVRLEVDDDATDNTAQ